MSDVELLHFSEENLHTGEGARVLHQCGVPATYKIHTHDFYELFLVSHGGAIHAVNGRSQLLSEGSFVLMRPRDVHRYDFFNNADFELLDIGIPRTVFERLCLRGFRSCLKKWSGAKITPQVFRVFWRLQICRRSTLRGRFAATSA